MPRSIAQRQGTGSSAGMATVYGGGILGRESATHGHGLESRFGQCCGGGPADAWELSAAPQEARKLLIKQEQR